MSGTGEGSAVPIYRRPWWVGAAILLMGVVWLHGASTIHATTNVIGIGPSVMVEVSGALLVVCGLVLIFQALKGEPFTPREEEGADPEAPASHRSFLLALAGVGLPLLAMERLGFPVVAALSFALVTHAFGSRRTVLDLIIGAIVSCLSWYCFSLLGINLGPFFPLID